MAPASAQEAGWRRSGGQLSAVLASKRGKATLVAILIATGGSYAYIQVQHAKAAKRRKRLRDSLRYSIAILVTPTDRPMITRQPLPGVV